MLFQKREYMMNVISEMRVHDKCYFRNMSCTLNNISTILAIFQSVAVHHDIGLYTKRDDADVHIFLVYLQWTNK